MLMALVALFAAASPITAAPTTAPTTAPGTMSVATFLAKAEALQAKGMMAMFASDVSLLKAEVAGAAGAYRRQLKQEATSGKPSACPPEHAALNSNELIAQMRTYPAADRPRIPVTQAVADLIRKRYPCH